MIFRYCRIVEKLKFFLITHLYCPRGQPSCTNSKKDELHDARCAGVLCERSEHVATPARHVFNRNRTGNGRNVIRFALSLSLYEPAAPSCRFQLTVVRTSFSIQREMDVRPRSLRAHFSVPRFRARGFAPTSYA